jgi:hypothetical protein
MPDMAKLSYGRRLLPFALLFFPFAGWAQVASGPTPTTRPLALVPGASVSPAGSVSVQQSTSAGGTNTVNTSLQINGNLQGSVPGANWPAGPITLKLVDAVRREVGSPRQRSTREC